MTFEEIQATLDNLTERARVMVDDIRKLTPHLNNLSVAEQRGALSKVREAHGEYGHVLADTLEQSLGIEQALGMTGPKAHLGLPSHGKCGHLIPLGSKLCNHGGRGT
jgi:hypothetical protein